MNPFYPANTNGGFNWVTDTVGLFIPIKAGLFLGLDILGQIQNSVFSMAYIGKLRINSKFNKRFIECTVLK